MKLERRPDGSLLLRHDPTGLRILLAALGVAVGLAVVLAQDDPTNRLLGGIGALLPIAMAALLEHSRFEFDAVRRRLRWSRRNLFRRLEGELEFGELRDAVVRSGVELDYETRPRRKRPNYRVVLLTAQGELELGNRRYYDEPEQQEIAGAIRAVLGAGAAARRR